MLFMMENAKRRVEMDVSGNLSEIEAMIAEGIVICTGHWLS